MALAKVIEVLAEGSNLEDAVEDAVRQASKTVRNIQNVYVKDWEAIVENNAVTKYRITAKVTFILEE
ncbi:MAG: dodecin family protein [bacterium]